MKDPDANDFTQLLLAWSHGEPAALEQLAPLVYDELRRLARVKMRGERNGHTWQTSDLVNEAWLRLADVRRVQWQNRAHFFAVAARLMRRVLVDHARSHNAQKQGGALMRVEFDQALWVASERSPEILALEDALQQLECAYPKVAQVVEMKFFAGLEGAEMAEVLSVTPGRVSQLWKFGQTWLRRELGGTEALIAE
jgi:RNA polymerase sigma factor (TIGR02999 family)